MEMEKPVSIVAELARRVAARAELAALDRLAIVRESPADRGEGDLRPRDFVPSEQPDLGAFRPGRDVRRGQVRAIDDLHLREPRDRVDREHALDLDLGARLLPGLAKRAVGGGLVQLVIAGRQGPETFSRIDGAPAQQDAVLPAADRADDDLRIFIVDETAIVANEALAVVAFRHPAHEGSRGASRRLAHAPRVTQTRTGNKPGARGAAPYVPTMTSWPTVIASAGLARLSVATVRTLLPSWATLISTWTSTLPTPVVKETRPARSAAATDKLSNSVSRFSVSWPPVAFPSKPLTMSWPSSALV